MLASGGFQIFHKRVNVQKGRRKEISGSKHLPHLPVYSARDNG